MIEVFVKISFVEFLAGRFSIFQNANHHPHTRKGEHKEEDVNIHSSGAPK
jgi:hypothetical protein